jgi:hypothetical protein
MDSVRLRFACPSRKGKDETSEPLAFLAESSSSLKST